MSDSGKPILNFPLPFSIKVIGRNTADFEQLILSIVNRHTSGIGTNALASRTSQKSNYVSVTVTFTAESQEQLDAIYQELSQHEQVLMVL